MSNSNNNLIYMCECCHKSHPYEPGDEIWYNIKEKHFSSLPTLCWDCAETKCYTCFGNGTWYQKYESCLCDACYENEIKRTCLHPGCGYIGNEVLNKCSSCKTYYCDAHVYGNNVCDTCFRYT